MRFGTTPLPENRSAGSLMSGPLNHECQVVEVTSAHFLLVTSKCGAAGGRCEFLLLQYLDVVSHVRLDLVLTTPATTRGGNPCNPGGHQRQGHRLTDRVLSRAVFVADRDGCISSGLERNFTDEGSD